MCMEPEHAVLTLATRCVCSSRDAPAGRVCLPWSHLIHASPCMHASIDTKPCVLVSACSLVRYLKEGSWAMRAMAAEELWKAASARPLAQLLASHRIAPALVRALPCGCAHALAVRTRSAHRWGLVSNVGPLAQP